VSDGDRNLWTAALYRSRDPQSNYDSTWIQYVGKADLEIYKNSLEIFRQSSRVSVSNLLLVGDASSMHEWRHFLGIAVEQMQQESSEYSILELQDTGVLLSRSISSTYDILKLSFRRLSSWLSSNLYELINGVQNQVVCSVLVLLTIFSLTNSELFDISNRVRSNDAFRRILCRILKHISTLNEAAVDAVLSDIGCIESLTEIYYFFFDCMHDIEVNSDSEKFDLINLCLKNLLASGGIYSVSLVLLSIDILFDITELEFQPRISLMYAWIRSLFEERLGISTAAEVEQFVQDFPTYIPDLCTISLDDNKREVQTILSTYLKSKLSSFNLQYETILRNQGVNTIDMIKYSECIEALSQKIVTFHVQFSLDKKLDLSKKVLCLSKAELRVLSDFRGVIIAKAPVRIDLAGGWSDTPPCSYESRGAVLNVAIKIDGYHPIRCEVRFTNELFISLKAVKENLKINASTPRFEVCDECKITSLIGFKDASNPSAHCSLIKAALITLGITDLIDKHSRTLGITDTENFDLVLKELFGAGIEIVGISSLPAGSGMGGSSILAAAVLAAVGALFGLDMTPESLVYLVSEVEQVMTTGKF
jgi:hypothetical protein